MWVEAPFPWSAYAVTPLSERISFFYLHKSFANAHFAFLSRYRKEVTLPLATVWAGIEISNHHFDRSIEIVGTVLGNNAPSQ